MSRTEFRYIDRGKRDLAVLLPGWAFDHQVFGRLDIEYNYLVPLRFGLEDFHESLERGLKGSECTLIGWSFGGVAGAGFLAQHPDLVKRAIFAGIKECYPPAQTEKMKTYLKRNKENYLKGFYRRCLRGHDAGEKAWYNSCLADFYLRNMDSGVLSEQLDHLSRNPLPVNELKRHEDKIIFVHGTEDAVVPVEETHSLRQKFSKNCFTDMENTGHLSFLHPGFKYLADSHVG